MSAIQQYERELSKKLISGLLKIPGLRLYGITEPSQFKSRTPTVSIRIEGKTPAAIAQILGEKGIFVWYGNFYAINLTEKLDVETSGGLLRIGLAHYNTVEEIEQLLQTLNEIV
jgi:selenocysteine lyase/cysteine desulfurase